MLNIESILVNEQGEEVGVEIKSDYDITGVAYTREQLLQTLFYISTIDNALVTEDGYIISKDTVIQIPRVIAEPYMLDSIRHPELYDCWWLSKDMENMGFMFEYCDKFCQEEFGVSGFDKLLFLDKFMRSHIREEMEHGHPKLLSQAAYNSFVKFIEVDCNGDYKQFITGRKLSNLAYNQFYWVGWIYAYIHFQSNLGFRVLIEKLPLSYMLSQYKLGHEMSASVFYSKIERRLR